MSNELIPAQYRKTAYSIFALIGVILGGTQVGFAAAEAAQPIWLTVALAVYAFVGGALGLTAAQHTPGVEQFGTWDGEPDDAEVDDLGDGDDPTEQADQGTAGLIDATGIDVEPDLTPPPAGYEPRH